MRPISSGQIKAARALLDWSQDDLAKAADLSATTIRSLETGNLSPRSAREVARAVMAAGLELTEGEGVRWRDPEIEILRELDCCDRLFRDIEESLRAKGGDLLAVAKTPEMLTQACGSPRRDNLARLEALSGEFEVKCLLSDAIAPRFASPSFELRSTSRFAFGPSSCFLYAGKCAYAQPAGRQSFLILVFDVAVAALENERHFRSLWDNALPLRVQPARHEERVSA